MVLSGAIRRAPIAMGFVRAVSLVLLSGCFGLAAARGYSLMGFAAVIAVPVVLFLSRSRSNGLVVGALLAAAIPYSTTFGVPQLGTVRLTALLALAGLVVVAVERGHGSTHVHPIDVLVLSFCLFAFVSWTLSPSVPGALSATVNFVTPLSFYAAVRLLGGGAERRLTGFLLAGGVIAAGTIAYEMAIARRPLFSSPDTYLWSATNTAFFRPSGVFGSPPSASTILGMIALLALPLAAQGAKRRRVALTGIGACIVGEVLTFTRGPLIGLVAGLVVYALVVSPRPRTVISMLGAALFLTLVVVAFVLPAIGRTQTFEEAFVRKGNFAVRQSYWREALPRVTNSAEHLFLGHGINSLVVGRPWLPGQLDPDVASSPTLFMYGTHSQYVRTLFDEGLVGFVLLIGWVGGSVLVGVRGARQAAEPVRRASASYAAAVVCFMTASVATDSARHPVGLAVVAIASALVVSVRTRIDAGES
jgi:hypothetical protein